MLHDGMMSTRTGRSTVEDDRRASDRLPFPGELVVLWHHDLSTPIRYRIVDAGDGGFRLRTSVPLLEGTTGIALQLLPGGEPLNQPIMVIWARTMSDGDQELGVRTF